MSYGTGRFSNLDLPNPTLSYVARKAFKHHDLAFAPGDLVSVEQLGTRHLTKYIRARLVELPVKPGEAVPPEAGAALVQEPRVSEAADEVVVIRTVAGQPVSDEARAVAQDIDRRMAETLIEKPAPAAAPIDPETMTKAQLSALIDEHGLQVDKRLPLGAMRAKVAAALEG